jgi:hypothetical protein
VTGHRRLCFRLPRARCARHVGRQRRRGKKDGAMGTDARAKAPIVDLRARLRHFQKKTFSTSFTCLASTDRYKIVYSSGRPFDFSDRTAREQFEGAAAGGLGMCLRLGIVSQSLSRETPSI